MATRISPNNLSIDITVRDYNRLQERLRKSPEVIQDRLNHTLKNISVDMEREAKMQVPVVTGRLQSSILTERQQLTYTIAPHTVYAEPVHRGNPYMDRAFNIVEPMARQELNQTVKDIIAGI